MKNKESKGIQVEALNTVIKALEPLVAEDRKKVIAAACAFFSEDIPTGGGSSKSSSAEGKESANVGEIISKNSNLRPGQKAAVVAYHLIKKSNKDQFTLDELRGLYKDIGLTPPDRFDMTLKSAVVKSNKLFKTAGRNAYALTFHGQELGKKISTTT